MRGPYPIGAVILPNTLFLRRDLRPGTVLAQVIIMMSDGSRFNGRMDTNGPLLFVSQENQMPNVVLGAALDASYPDGAHIWTCNFVQSGVTVPVAVFASVNAPPPALTITVSGPGESAANPAMLPAGAAAGTPVCNLNIAGGDQTPIALASATDENGVAISLTFNP